MQNLSKNMMQNSFGGSFLSNASKNNNGKI